MGLTRKAGKALRAWLPRAPRKQQATSVSLNNLPEASDLNEDDDDSPGTGQGEVSCSRPSTGSVWSFTDEPPTQEVEDEVSVESDERVMWISALRLQRTFRAHRVQTAARLNAQRLLQPHDRPALLPPSDEEVCGKHTWQTACTLRLPFMEPPQRPIVRAYVSQASIEGWLVKRGSGFPYAWQPRYFIFLAQRRVLCYYAIGLLGTPTLKRALLLRQIHATEPSPLLTFILESAAGEEQARAFSLHSQHD